VINILEKEGIEPGKTGACRVLIDQHFLHKKEQSNLLRLYVEHEDLLYHIAGSGQEGRPIQHKLDGYADSYMGRYAAGPEPAIGGWNFGLRREASVIEFRHLDATTCANGLMANICLILSLVGQATNDCEPNQSKDVIPHFAEAKQGFSTAEDLDRWKRLLAQTVGENSEIARTLTEIAFPQGQYEAYENEYPNNSGNSEINLRIGRFVLSIAPAPIGLSLRFSFAS
jgi:hypothetical protein